MLINSQYAKLPNPVTTVTNVPFPSSSTAHMKKWVMCEWDNEFPGDSTVQDDASFDTLQETRNYVMNHLNDVYETVADDTIKLKDYPIVAADSSENNAIYTLPDESTELQRIVLCQSTNGDRVFGLSVWKNGYNPDFVDD